MLMVRRGAATGVIMSPVGDQPRATPEDGMAGSRTAGGVMWRAWARPAPSRERGHCARMACTAGSHQRLLRKALSDRRRDSLPKDEETAP